MPQVGDGYIEVDTRIDSSGYKKFNENFKKEWQKTLKDVTGKNDKFWQAANSRELKARQALEAQKRRSMAQSADAQLKSINKQMAAARDLEAFKRKSIAAERISRREELAHAARTARLYRNRDRDQSSFLRHLGQGFEGILSLMPARLEQLFSKTGPVAGSAFLAAFAGAVMIGLPALGAMISGVLFASLGLGAVLAAGIVGAVKDPRVNAAAKRLGDNFMNKIIYDKRVQFLGQVLANQLDKVNKALNRWAPHIQNILIAGAKYLPTITNGLIGMVDGFLAPMDRLINSPFMQSLMNVLANGLKKIGQAFGISFDRFLNDPAAMRGAIKGLDDFFNVIAGGIKLIFDFLRAMSSFWEKLNAKGKDGKSPLDKMRDGWKSVKDVLDDIANSTIVPILHNIKGAFDDLKKPLGDSMGYLKKFGDWMDNKDNQEHIATVTKLVVALKVAMFAYAAAVKAAGAAQATFMAAGGFGAIGGKGGLKGAGKGAGVGILGSLLFGGGLQETAGAAAGGAVAGPIGAAIGAALGHAIDLGIKAANPYVHSKMHEFWNSLLKGEWQKAWSAWVNGSITPQFMALKFLFNAGLSAIRTTAKVVWGSILNTLKQGWGALLGTFTQNLNFIKAVWNSSWGSVKAHAIIAWNSTFAFFRGWITNIRNWWTNSMRFIRTTWTNSWGSVKTTAVNHWNSIFALFRGWVTNVRNWWSNTLRFIKGLWNATWGSVKATAISQWNSLFALLRGWLTNIKNWWNNTLRAVKNFWNTTWGAIKEIATRILGQILGTVRSRVETLKKTIGDALKSIRKTWNDIWSGMHKFLGGIWGKITGAVRSGINAVLGVINKGIDMINGALKKLGVGFQISHIGGVSGPPAKTPQVHQGHSTGGRITGPGTSTSDSIYGGQVNGAHHWVSRDEFVVNAKAAKHVGYNNLERLNSIGLAGGGRVGPENNDLLNQHRNHVHVAMMQGINYIVAMARKSGIPFRVTSTRRPGDRVANGGLSWHSSGKAVDFGGFNQDAFASYWLRTPGVMELIHRTNKRDYAIFGGKASSGGGGGGIFDWIGKGWNWVLEHILRPAGNKATNLLPENNGLNALGKGWTKAIFNKAVDKAKVEFDDAKKAMAAGDGTTPGLGGGPGGGAKWASVIAQALKMLHLPSSWNKPTQTLIDRESGGNPRAINLWDSNAKAGTPSKGLMQVIPPTFIANHYPGHNDIYNPLDNILAGLTYIRRHYGSIFNVQQAVGSTPRGYDNGGWLYPGMGGVNMTTKPEMVLNHAQGLALKERISAGGSPTIYVMIDGVAVAHRVHVEQNNAELVRTLRTGVK